MSKKPGNRGASWAKLRMDGFRRCAWSVQRSRGTWEGGDLTRTPAAKKGQQCAVMVSPAQIKKVGLPICPQHEPHFHEALEEDERRRKALREKYDPGPLPLDEEEAA